MQHPQLGPEGFFFRWIAIVALVLATYNGSKFNFVSWVINGSEAAVPFMVLVGAILAIGYYIVMRATASSLGVTGVLLVFVFFAAAIWSLVSLGLVNMGDHSILLYLTLLAFATILAIGMSWSIIQRRLTGQVNVVEE